MIEVDMCDEKRIFLSYSHEHKTLVLIPAKCDRHLTVHSALIRKPQCARHYHPHMVLILRLTASV